MWLLGASYQWWCLGQASRARLRAGAATAAGGLVSVTVPSLSSGSRARVYEAAGQALLSSLDKQARH